ncbi:hypothetical protein L1887_01677 [Cichorium endivia]|nr:hypothetical protein L1887_01677 [Cichorium endivia]
MVTGAFRDDKIFSYSLSTAVGEGGNRLPVLSRRSCDEIYIVEEGETLHTISDKCGDPFIVEKTLISMILMMFSLASSSRSPFILFLLLNSTEDEEASSSCRNHVQSASLLPHIA